MLTTHLLRTSDCPIELYDDIFSILSPLKGEISFAKTTHTVEIEYAFSWEKAWQVCSTFRTQHQIPDTDFVVLLTHKPNRLNWFGTIQPDLQARNMFIHTDGWDYFTNSKPQYPICFEIACYLLHYFMKLDVLALEHNKHYPYIHEEPIGCINDMCNHKADIALNLRTADICEKCCQKILEEKVPETILEQLFKIMETVRAPMLARALFRNKLQPSQLVIDEHFNITLPDFGGRNIEMTALGKALYLFILVQPEPYSITRLEGFGDDFLQIKQLYQNIPGARNPDRTIENFVSSLQSSRNTLSETVSKINSAIKKAMPEFSTEIIGSYKLSCDENGRRFILLSKDKIVIENQIVKEIFQNYKVSVPKI